MVVVRMMPCDFSPSDYFQRYQFFSNNQGDEGWQTVRVGHRFRIRAW
jgi:hypothetical protein